jgi:2-dehydro-3-deoxygalactonokinase
MGTTVANLGQTSDSGLVTHATTIPRTPVLIAVDWGTTCLRAWLMGDGGRILATRRHAKGSLSIAELPADERIAEHERIYLDVCGDWIHENPQLPSIACGMVGSSEGWTDAGYLSVPTDLAVNGADLTEVHHRLGSVHLVPGLRIASRRDAPGDVLRGEETQLIGVLDLVEHTDLPHTIVLPGTHTKWVQVDKGEVISFTTVMTGEIFGLLIGHGLLARTARPGRRDDSAFARGLRTAADRGLPSELFGGRALVLDGLLDADSLPDYVSGVLIADEVRHRLPACVNPQRITLCGAPDLCRRYATALTECGAEPLIVTEEATVRGLWVVAQRAGLVDPNRSIRQEATTL